MRNKAFRINGERGIVGSGQFCSSLLQNWDLNTHRPDETFRTRAGELV
jgi:hypothetical protein